MLAATRYEHIILDDGVPKIEPTTMKVIELVLEQRASGATPEELRLQHPYLSLGQIYSALAYYWDHQDELDADIKRRLAQVQRLRSSLPDSPALTRLKDLRHLSPTK